MIEQFGYTTVMQVPRIVKITLNMGVGEAVADKKVMENAVGIWRNCRSKSGSDQSEKINRSI